MSKIIEFKMCKPNVKCSIVRVIYKSTIFLQQLNNKNLPTSPSPYRQPCSTWGCNKLFLVNHGQAAKEIVAKYLQPKLDQQSVGTVEQGIASTGSLDPYS